tara:strand:- start:1056 stop:1226 length:171 start_codon:yes stop_codon:yes gene_type:complete
MAEEAKKETKKAAKKEVKVATKCKIEKPNGNVIYRDALGDAEVKAYEAKGCKVGEA